MGFQNPDVLDHDHVSGRTYHRDSVWKLVSAAHVLSFVLCSYSCVFFVQSRLLFAYCAPFQRLRR